MATINGTPGNDSLIGTSDNDTLSGCDGNDTLDSGSGNDFIDDSDGDDLYIFNSNDGQDQILNILGNDTYIVNRGSLNILENANGGYDTVEAQVSYTLSANIEDLTLTGGAYQLLTLPNGLKAEVYGNPLTWGKYLDYYQGDNDLGYTGDCGIVACENVLIQTGGFDLRSGYSPNFFGIDDYENIMVSYAASYDWCDEDGGTSSYDRLRILSGNLSAQIEEDASLYDIANYILDNKCVIAEVDSWVLWGYGDEF